MNYFFRISYFLLLALLISSQNGIMGCSKENPPSCKTVSDILIEPQQAILREGEKIKFTAWEVEVILGPNPGEQTYNKLRVIQENIIWSSTNLTTATVDNVGNVSALSAGRTQIRATWDTSGGKVCYGTWGYYIPPPPAKVFVYDRADVPLSGMSAKVAIHTGKDLALVTLPFSDTIVAVTLPGGAVSTSLTLPSLSFPQGIAISPSSNKALVANTWSDTVSVIDLTASPVFLSPFTLPGASGPIAVNFSPTGNAAFIANFSSGTLSIVDVTPNPPLEKATIGIGISPTGITMSPTGNAIIVLGMSNTLTFVSLDAWGETFTYNVSGEAGLGGIAIDTKAKKAYVTHVGTVTNPGRTISIIDVSVFPPVILATVQGEIGPYESVLSSVSGIVIVGNSGSVATPGNSLSLIEEQDIGYGTGFTVSSTIPVGVNPAGIAVLAGTNLAVVAHSGDKSLSLIRLPLP